MEGWLIAMIIVVIVLIGLILYFRFFYHPGTAIPGATSDNVYIPNVTWSNPTVAPGSRCRGFTFGMTMVDGQVRCGLNDDADVQFLQMNSPNYATSILNAMLPKTTDPTTCVDIDQINAIEVIQTCSKTSLTTNNEAAWCPRNDGTFASFGEEYSYYTPCTSDTKFGNALFCPGSISGVTLGFPENCIASVTTTPSLQDGCNLASVSQQFRVIRTSDPSLHPSSSLIQGSTGNNGIYMALVHRDTGLCLMPTSDRPGVGSGVSLRECTSNNNGYVWAMIEPLEYPVTSAGIFNVNGGYTATSPQQLTYIGATSNPNIRLNSSNGAVLGAFLTDTNNYTLSMYDDGGVIRLGPYQTCGLENGAVKCDNTEYMANILTMTDFNSNAISNACQ